MLYHYPSEISDDKAVNEKPTNREMSHDPDENSAATVTLG